MLIILLTISSCVIDTIPLRDSVKNCTNDTLYIDISHSDTLPTWEESDVIREATNEINTKDTSTITTDRKQIILTKYYRALPNSTLPGGVRFDSEGTCFLYVVQWEIATQYTIEKIRDKHLYEKRVLTRKDFHNHIYEYRIDE